MNDIVACTLAHPLGAEGARSVGLEFRDHEVGEDVTLLRGHAMRLVGAGLVEGADPKDRESVDRALRAPQQSAAGGVVGSIGTPPDPAGEPVPGKPSRVGRPTPGDAA